MADSAPQPRALLTCPDTRLPATGDWAYLLVPMSHARTLPPFALTGLAVRSRVITTDTQNHKDREWAIANGCCMTSGEYLLTVNPSQRAPDTTRQKMLALLALLAQDASTQELNDILRQETKLSYSLLRLVNSAAIAPRTPITSFSQAIDLLGRRQLERWVQLLIFANPEQNGGTNPLLYTAALRGRLMELLVPQLKLPHAREDMSDSAFMTGCFSLLSVLLHPDAGNRAATAACRLHQGCTQPSWRPRRTTPAGPGSCRSPQPERKRPPAQPARHQPGHLPRGTTRRPALGRAYPDTVSDFPKRVISASGKD